MKQTIRELLDVLKGSDQKNFNLILQKKLSYFGVELVSEIRLKSFSMSWDLEYEESTFDIGNSGRLEITFLDDTQVVVNHDRIAIQLERIPDETEEDNGFPSISDLNINLTGPLNAFVKSITFEGNELIFNGSLYSGTISK